MRIIDFHAHAFPDSLAPRAMEHLIAGGAEAGARAWLDGTTADLLRSMDRSGIETSVVASILTKPFQFKPVLDWSSRIRSERLVPFPSVHPDDPRVRESISIVRKEGYAGLKLHPYYQGFDMAEERLFPLYEEIQTQKLILLCHTGFDLAFPRSRLCDPDRILAVLARFPELKLVTSHLGAWMDWDEVEAKLIGRPIYMDISYSLLPDPAPRAREMLLAHPQEYLLFGSDSPWADQAETLAAVRDLKLGAEKEAALLSGNATRLLAPIQ